MFFCICVLGIIYVVWLFVGRDRKFGSSGDVFGSLVYVVLIRSLFGECRSGRRIWVVLRPIIALASWSFRFLIILFRLYLPFGFFYGVFCSTGDGRPSICGFGVVGCIRFFSFAYF